MLGHHGYIGFVKDYPSAVGEEGAGDCAEKGTLSRSVCADDGDEIALFNLKRKVLYRSFCVDCSGIEGFLNMRN